MADEGLVFSIGADTDPLEQGLKDAKKVVEDFSGALEGALAEATQQLGQLNTKLEGLLFEKAFGDGSANAKQLNKDIALTKLQISLITKEVKSYQDALDSSSSNSFAQKTEAQTSAQLAFNRVIRDAHSLTYSMTRGISELTYALPNLGSKLAEVIEETGGWKNALTTISASIFNWQTALFAVGTAIAFWVKGHKEAKQETDKFADSIAKEQLSFMEVASVVTNANVPLNERKVALTQLKNEYGNYLQGLSDEQILAGNLGNAYEKINNALVSKLILQAGEEKLLPLIKQQLALRQKQGDLEADAARGAAINAADIDRANRAHIASVGAIKAAGTGAATELKKVNAELEAIGIKIKNEFGSLQSLLQDTAGLTYKPDKNSGKSEEEKEIDILKQLSKQLAALDEQQKSFGGNLDPKRIEVYNEALKKLFTVGATGESASVKFVIGEELPIQLRNAIREMQAEARKELSKDNITAPIEVKLPVIFNLTPDQAALAHLYRQLNRDEMLKILKKAGVKNITADGITVPVNPYISDEALTKGFVKWQQDTEAQTARMTASIKNYIVNDIGGAFNDVFTTILEGGGNAIEEFGKDIEKLIVKLVAAVAEAALLSLILNATGLGAAGGFTSTFKNLASTFKIPGFATGGVVPSGYPNDTYLARLSSGERVVTPGQMNAMRNMGGSGDSGGTLTTRISGNDLVIILDRAQRSRVRSY